jgi:hypothetical protein
MDLLQELIGITEVKSADWKNQKPTGEVLKALAYYLGFSNLGFHADFKDGKIVLGDDHRKVDPSDLRGIVSAVERELGSIAESDEMYSDFMDEIDSWVKMLSKDTLGKIATVHKELAPVIPLMLKLDEAIGKVKKGGFHKWLGKSEDEPITDADIERGLKSRDPHAREMANFARNSRKWKKE